MLSASAVTFSTSLPVAQDQIIVRFNFQPSFSTRQQNSFQFPMSIGYGYSARLGFFVNLSQGFTAIDSVTPTGNARPLNGGFGDMGFYGRYTLFKIDRPNSTFRITPLVGAFLPTGNNTFTFGGRLQGKALQTGSGTVDPYTGVAVGFSSKRWSANFDTTWRLNPLTTTNFSPGSEVRSDGQVEFKIYPVQLPEEGLPKQLQVSFETNAFFNQRDHLGGVLNANSGGKILRESVLLELGSLRWQCGGGIQLPMLQDLNGTGRTRLKVGYLFFFEYYLSAPGRRRHA